MSNQLTRHLPAAMLLSAAIGLAQSEVPVWKGELRCDSPRLFEGYTVELIDEHHSRAGRSDVRSDGRFEFIHLAEGMYEVQVSDGRGSVVYDDFARVANGMNGFEVRLPKETSQQPPTGPVSVRQLLHPPQPKAIAFARAAEKDSAAGQYAKAASELESAVQISPDYAEARTNLGAQYLRLGRYRDALDQSQRAMEIQPAVPTLTNLAYAQLMLDRTADAEATARAALRLDAGSAIAHYVLGLALAVDGSQVDAVAHLEKAAETLPGARTNLEKIRAQWAARERPDRAAR